MKPKIPSLILLSLTALVAANSPLCAKDKANSLPHDWSGPYVGLYASHAMGDAFDNYLGGPTPATFDQLPLTGNGGGVLAGYTFQQGGMVYGLEADLGQTSTSGFKDVFGATLSDAYRTDVSEGWNCLLYTSDAADE